MKIRGNLINNVDWLTVFIYFLLIFFGWLNIYAAGFNEQHRSIFDVSQVYGKQLLWIIAAIILIITIFLIDEKFFFFFSYPIYVVSFLSLIMVLLLGTEIHGSKSWFVFWKINLQPSEFAKIATALALAKFVSSYNFKINKFWNIIIIFLIIFLPAILITFQPDMGTAIIFLSFLLVIYREGFSAIVLLIGILFIGLFILTLLVDQLFILAGLIVVSFIILWLIRRKISMPLYALLILAVSSGLLYGLTRIFHWNLSYYAILATGLLIALPFYVKVALYKKMRNVLILTGCLIISVMFTFSVDYVYHEILKEHQRTRLNILLGIESDPLGHGYNVNQSKIAIGSGGFTGKGFLNGTQTKFDFVPEQSTDFIFCTVGEEWGFIGTFLVIGLFILLMLRLLKISERQRSDFSRIYGYSVISIIFVHFAINIGMTIGLLPVIGIPLPFFSYGGSALWGFTILLFIMIRLDASRTVLLK
jgi:rod shape determining protein RodA